MIGTDAYALFTRAVTVLSFPSALLFHARLTDPFAQPFILEAIKKLGLLSA